MERRRSFFKNGGFTVHEGDTLELLLSPVAQTYP
jgi:hypothetical protein